MTELDTPKINKTKNVKLYSSKAISIATVFGGPIAASYLISENYKAIEKPDEGRTALLIGLIATLLLFGALFFIPEHIIDKVPNQIIPLIYTAIIWAIVEWKQGDILKAHEENENFFFSKWRAAGIGLIAMVILLIGIVGYTYLEANNPSLDIYDTEMVKFSTNENESLAFYDHLNTESVDELIKELNKKTIPIWKENVNIIKKTNTLEDLPEEVLDQNRILLKYAELRIDAFQLFNKALKEDTDKYNLQIEQIHTKIELELAKLN